MQNTSAKSEGCTVTLMKRREARDEPSKSSGRISTPAAGSESHGEHSEEPLMVTQEAVEAYEKRTGFYGIGKIMVEDGHWVIVTKEELAQSKARAHANRIMVTHQRGIA